MGREIVYCSQCGVRILEKDLATGRAFTVLDKVFCAECRDQAFAESEAAAPAARAAARPAPRPGPAKSAAPAPRPPPAGRVPGPRLAPEGISAPHAPKTIVHRPNRTPLYIACAVGMIGLVVGIIVVMQSGSAPGKSGDGGPAVEGGGGGTHRPPDKTLTPHERAAKRLSDLMAAATVDTDPASVVKKAVEAEKDIVGTPSEEEYRKFRKRWERKVQEIESGKKIDALLVQAKGLAAADPEFKKYSETLAVLQQAEELAVELGSEKLADVKNQRRDLEEPYETKADEWFERNGPAIRQWMNEGEFKGARKLIEKFPEGLRLSKVWRINLTKWIETCDKGIAAAAAKAAGKEVEKDWTVYLRIGLEDLQRKNYAKAKESLEKAEKGMPKIENPTDDDKRRVAWALYYNFACLYADWSKKLEGAEKTKAVDSAFEYLAKSAEAGVFAFPCRCGKREHTEARNHWDTDEDLETIRKDARYAALVEKHAKK